MKNITLTIVALIFGFSLLSVSGCVIMRVKEKTDVHHKHKDKDRDDRHDHEESYDGDRDNRD